MKATGKNNKSNLNQYIYHIIAYAAFCIIVYSVAAVFMNRLMAENNANQMNETIGLIAEKVNVSFDMMASDVEKAADIISVHEPSNLEEEYAKLRRIPANGSISRGIIDKDGNYYCTEAEKHDMEKYGYAEQLEKSSDMFISEPYLSCVTGTNVITIFAPVYASDMYAGSIYETYPLESVQKLARTSVLKHEVESYFMDSRSGNFISCSASKNHAAGVWSNLSLVKADMKCLDGYDYNVWFENMRSNSKDNVLCFMLGGVAYTQAYIKISSMEDWYVVVRIPNTELTLAMHDYLKCISIFATILILGTAFFGFMLYYGEHRQKKHIEEISGTDPLTGLLNRRTFNDAVEDAFKDPLTARRNIYVFVDIDFFKEINDTYGHAAGDDVLKAVAAELEDIFGEYAIIARVGGDEFNLLLMNIDRIEMVDEMLELFAEHLKDMRLPNGTILPITCSVGLARYMKDASNITTLTERADIALYHIKRNGKGGYCWYNSIKDDKEE